MKMKVYIVISANEYSPDAIKAHGAFKTSQDAYKESRKVQSKLDKSTWVQESNLLDSERDEKMSDNKYNGWSNRETWLVNLHYGGSQEWLADMVKIADGDIDRLADYLQEEIRNQVEEVVNGDMFISDLINLSSIDWRELAQAYITDYHIEEEER